MKEEESKSFAKEILEDYKTANKRLFIILLIVILGWMVTIGYFIYYASTMGYEITTETAETSDNGNACVGDNCINGDMYGESN